MRKLVRKNFGPSKTTHRYVDSKGRRRFKGSSTLKRTQEYPSPFARSASRPYLQASTVDSKASDSYNSSLTQVFRNWREHADQTRAPMPAINHWPDAWDDAKCLALNTNMYIYIYTYVTYFRYGVFVKLLLCVTCNPIMYNISLPTQA